jgi:hypothetical protein
VLDYKDGHEFRYIHEQVLWDFLNNQTRTRWQPAQAFVRLWRCKAREQIDLQRLALILDDSIANVNEALEALGYPAWLATESLQEGRLVYLDGRFHAASIAQYL